MSTSDSTPDPPARARGEIPAAPLPTAAPKKRRKSPAEKAKARRDRMTPAEKREEKARYRESELRRRSARRQALRAPARAAAEVADRIDLTEGLPTHPAVYAQVQDRRDVASDQIAAAAPEILQRLGDGEHLSHILGDDRPAGWPSVGRWLRAIATDELPGLAAAYARARLAWAWIHVEDVVHIADDTSLDTIEVTSSTGQTFRRSNGEWIARSRVRIETRLRLLELFGGLSTGGGAGGRQQEPTGTDVPYPVVALPPLRQS